MTMEMDEIDGVTGINSLYHATEFELAFWDGKDTRAVLSSKAKNILVNERLKSLESKNCIVVDNPRLEFIKYAWRYHPPKGNRGPVYKQDDVEIGENCSIGYDGFGYERDEDGKLWKFPHYGGVIIESGVEIAQIVCIDRGTFDNTYIGEGTKIDNLVHVAHNVRVGKYCMIVAGTVIGGGAIIGDYSFLGINSSIRDGIVIGEWAVVGMGAVVVEDVDPYTTVIGNPAKVYEK